MKDLTLKLRAYLGVVLIAVQSFYPTFTYALADAPSQVEYETYEKFNSTDMVNLITGDFSYNIPLLTVPSPEGGFSVPLSYHAGIEVNEDASWVGLGWGLNPGALTRRVSVYPDDFNGQTLGTSISNAGGTNLVKSALLYKEYYENGKATGGNVSLLGLADVGWGSQPSFGIAPIGLQIKDGEIAYSAEYMGRGLSVVPGIAISAVNPVVGMAYSALNTAASYAMMNSTANFRANDWKVDVENNIKLGFGTYKEKYYIDHSSSSTMFGSLYLGNKPTCEVLPDASYKTYNVSMNNGSSVSADNNTTRTFSKFQAGCSFPSSDMYINYNGSYANSKRPTSISYDSYQVMGEGVVGGIKPYRKDMGSFSNPIIHQNSHRSFQGVKFLNSNLYKTQFKYNGDFSNSYTFHQYDLGNPHLSLLNQSYGFDFDGSQVSPTQHQFKVAMLNPKLYVNYQAIALPSNPLNAYNWQYNTVNQAQANRIGLQNNRLAHAKNIEWYTNNEITSGNAELEGFMNTHQINEGTWSRPLSPSDGIGGFAVTNEMGITYHYSIPVYNNEEKYCAREYIGGNSPNVYFNVVNANKYATLWLLTGITGPDYVDRGIQGAIDEEDWGYWVQFDYGRFSNNYQWRLPFHGFSYVGNKLTYKWGNRESYYLNKIKTRTHTALFIKSLRSDGKSFYCTDGADANNNSVSSKPSSSLKLDDIYVVSNKVYNELTSGINPITYINTQAQNSKVFNGDTYNNVLDKDDITSRLNELNIKAESRIKFNYNYQLCNGTFNSFDFDQNGNAPLYNDENYTIPTPNPFSGKLTLKSIEFYGTNNTKTLPGYEFVYGDEQSLAYDTEYGDNPDYHWLRADFFGKYKSVISTNQPGSLQYKFPERKADQWCLSKVITPTGGEISVFYERDEYSSINGVSFQHWHELTTQEFTNGPTLNKLTYNEPLSTPPGSYGYKNYSKLTDGDQLYVNYSNNTTLAFKVIKKTPTWIEFDQNILQTGQTMNNINKMYFEVKRKLGDGLRVSKIEATDEDNNKYVTKYIYTKNGDVNGKCSGDASFEPTHYFDGGQTKFYEYADHPYLPVLYSYVTVVNSSANAAFPSEGKQTFHFVTSKEGMLEEKVDDSRSQTGHCNSPTLCFDEVLQNWIIDNRTASIGSLDTIKAYNKFGDLVNLTYFTYTDNSDKSYPDNMGYYTENTILWETFFDKNDNGVAKHIYRLAQTYKVNRPNILKRVTTIKDRLKSTTDYLEYDYMTGRPKKIKMTYGDKEEYQTETRLAYEDYPELGPKGLDVTNKNITYAASQETKFVYDKNHSKKPISSYLNTWSYLPKIRIWNSNSNSYESQSGHTNSILPDKSYVWKSSVSEDGTIQGWTVPSINAGNQDKWKLVSQINLYDQYSKPLEVYNNLNGSTASVKYGYDNSFRVGEAKNSKYNSWCYSGAEDRSSQSGYYSGEVFGSNFQFASTVYSHTGKYCAKIPSGQVGFRYKVNYTDLPKRGIYRASVWINQNGVNNARLICQGFTQPNNQGQVTLAPHTTFSSGNGHNNNRVESAGSWHLFTLDIDCASIPQNVSYLLFQVINPLTTNAAFVYADDFRVFNISDPIIVNVYDKDKSLVMATLNEEGYATKYIYDDAGRLKYTFDETKNGFVKRSETKYSFYK